MGKSKLNRIYDYKIASPYTMCKADRQTLTNNPITCNDDWSNDCYDELKQKIKRNHLLKQNDRCAYCRNWVEVDGKYEPIEHIVAKSLQPNWMFKVNNLVVACDTCNNLKGDQPTLKPQYNHWVNFPNKSEAFIIYNPHFDKWSDHFKIEDEIFLVAKRNSKGDETIRICKLNRYHIPINNARNLQMTNRNTAKSLAQKLYLTTVGSKEYKQIEEAINHIQDRI